MRLWTGVLGAVLWCAGTAAQSIVTTAGSGVAGFSGDGGAATSARIDLVYGVAADSRGNLYIADTRNHRIRRIANGTITTAAGNGVQGFLGDNGPATAARLWSPRDVAVDAQGNLYIADTTNCRIRKVTPAGTITTIAGDGTAGFGGDGGAAARAQLNYPAGVAADNGGNLYVADSWNYRIRKITPDGKIQTVAGNGSYGPFGDGGPATAASLGLIESLAVDSLGNLYLSDSYHHRIRKVTPSGEISIFAGGAFGPAADGGAALRAAWKFPKGIAVDSQGNVVVADSLNQRIRKISVDGTVGTVAGAGEPGYAGEGGSATAAWLNSPTGLAFNAAGNLVFSDLLNYRVRIVTDLPAVAPPVPVIRSVAGSAGGQPFVTPGAYASVYGTNLAAGAQDWSAAIVARQLPTQLGGVTVTVGGRPAYLSYVSPSQINFVAPDLAPGPAAVQVVSAGAVSQPYNATVQRYDPAFFLWGQYAVATHTDYTLCAKAGQFPGLSSSPAKPGEWIVFWGSGFGVTEAPLGLLTPADKTYLTAPVTVTVGGVNAQLAGDAAAMAPGYAGLYQIAVQIPAWMADGDHKVRAVIGGVQSPDNVFLTVKR